MRVDHELYPSYVTTQTAREAFTNVLANVGANFPKQDVIDRHVIKEVRNGTAEYIGTRAADLWPAEPARITPASSTRRRTTKLPRVSKNFPWPEYHTYNVPVDSDHDGMPDDWEKSARLEPARSLRCEHGSAPATAIPTSKNI